MYFKQLFAEFENNVNALYISFIYNNYRVTGNMMDKNFACSVQLENTSVSTDRTCNCKLFSRVEQIINLKSCLPSCNLSKKILC